MRSRVTRRPNVGTPRYASPMDPRRESACSPFPVDPADIPEPVFRAVWRTMIRQGHDADEDDARLLAAMAISIDLLTVEALAALHGTDKAANNG